MVQAKQPVPAGKTLVRLSIRPDEETLVDIDEVPVLRQQGLLAEGKPAGAPAGDGAGGGDAS
jgi:hypothetical protein